MLQKGDILEKELSERVVGMFIGISKKYGCLYKEQIFQKACEEYLSLNNISFVPQPKIKIYSLDSGKMLGIYIPDLLIKDKIIIEIKVEKFLSKIALRQLEQYLKASKYEIGYIVNFGEPKAKWYRCIYTNDRKPHLSV